MAFDYGDTDKIYRTIKKALKDTTRGLKGSPRIVPVRVDKIEHNDDIDDRIIREIKDADFAIADLTYARPSVYFEAGYAQRQVPVVYTCRRDHFRPEASDTYGNRRVHFDLQMKNIIPWRDATDAEFGRRLASRVQRVIVPIIKKRHARAEEDVARQAFLRLPMQQRFKTLLDAAASALVAASYRPCRNPQDIRIWLEQHLPSVPRDSPSRALLKRLTDLTGHAGIVVFRRDRGRVSRHVAVLIAESLTAGALDSVRDVMVAAAPWDCRLRGKTSPERAEDTLLLCSLSPVPLRRVTSALPDFAPDAVDALVGDRQLPLPAIPTSGEVVNVLLPAMRHCGERNGAVVFAKDGGHCWGWDSYWRSAIATDQVEGSVDLPMRMTNRRIEVRLLSNVTSVGDFEARLRASEFR